MRAPRIYTPQPLTTGQFIELETQASLHLGKVLRKQAGDEIILFNGDGSDYSACIERIEKKHISVIVGQGVAAATESPLAIHLGISISKGERMDFVMQKACELGVTEITPLFTERTIVKLKGERLQKKQQHWQQIIISACEQSGRSIIPRIHTPGPLDAWLKNVDADKKLVLHHRCSEKLEGGESVNSVILLVGPEGGLSEAEITLAQDGGFKALALGPRVMRTETAPLAAISVLQFTWGDFG